MAKPVSSQCPEITSTACGALPSSARMSRSDCSSLSNARRKSPSRYGQGPPPWLDEVGGQTCGLGVFPSPGVTTSLARLSGSGGPFDDQVFVRRFPPTAVQLGLTAVDAVAALRGSHRVGIGCAPQDPGPRPELPDLGSRRRGQSQSCGSPQARPERARSEPPSLDGPEISGRLGNGRLSCVSKP